MMILRGVTLFPYYDLGGLWKISNENEGGGGNHFFLEKEMKICCDGCSYNNSCQLS